MSDVYQVEKILDKRKDKSGVKYLLKWIGYPINESTWEPESSLENIRHLIDEYENNLNDNSQRMLKQKRSFRRDDSEDVHVVSETSNKASFDKEKQIKAISFAQKSSFDDSEGNVNCDIPLKIISAKYIKNSEIQCLVEWKPRYNKSVPKNSYVSSSEMRKLYYNLLLDFYESKIR